jgi:hypothetical protein
MRLEDLLRTVKQAVHDHGTKVVAIDDITRLKLHREADQDTLDMIRELMSTPVTLILIGVGIYKSGLLRNGRRDPVTGQWVVPPVKDRGKSRNDDAPDQTDLRFEPVDLDRFSYGGTASTGAWIAHLVGLEQQLRLLNARDGMLSEGAMPSTCSATPAASSASCASSSRRHAAAPSRPARKRSPPLSWTP